jgi:hypothetical protein
MSQLVKTKRQANFKGFKRFGAFKGIVEQKKNVVFNSFVCKLGQKKPNASVPPPKTFLTIFTFSSKDSCCNVN